MRYFLDTEFNGFGGDLISMALIGNCDILGRRQLYLVYPESMFRYEPWVKENVLPFVDSVPDDVTVHRPNSIRDATLIIANFLRDDPDPVIVADWPDDIHYFCEATITGPGKMIDIPSLKFEMHRVDAYPTKVVGAIQHNAYWDALALANKLEENFNG